MLKLNFIYTNTMVQELLKIEKYVRGIDDLFLPTKAKQKLMYEAKLKRTHYSTSIEGNYLTLKQVENVVKSKNESRIKMEREVANYWEALTFLEKCKSNNQDIDIDLILELHAIIENTGKGKTGGYRGPTPPGVLFAVRDDQTRAIDYIPPQAEDIKECMDDLIYWYNTNRDLPVPIIAGIMHYGLTTIHPFDDGNGRTSRALATYILMKNDYDLRGFNYLEEYYRRDLSGYYNNLQMNLPALSYDGRLNPPHLEIWLEYFIKTMAINAQQVYDMAYETSKNETIMTEVLNLGKREILLIKYFLDNNKDIVKPVELTSIYSVSSRALVKRCSKWVEKGILVANYKDKYIVSYSLAPAYKNVRLRDLGFIDE